MLEVRHPRIYQWVKPRSLGLHLLFVLIASGCLIAAWWQVHRAMQGNGLSYFYSVEWPAFAVVAGIGWWQMFHDTPEDIAERKAFHQRMRQASAEVVARTLPRSARALTVGSHEVGGPAIAGPVAPALPAEGGFDGGASGLPALRPSGALDALGGVVDLAGEDIDEVLRRAAEDPDSLAGDELADYNRYLALLAVKGQAKTWRNPRGIR